MPKRRTKGVASTRMAHNTAVTRFPKIVIMCPYRNTARARIVIVERSKSQNVISKLVTRRCVPQCWHLRYPCTDLITETPCREETLRMNEDACWLHAGQFIRPPNQMNTCERLPKTSCRNTPAGRSAFHVGGFARQPVRRSTKCEGGSTKCAGGSAVCVGGHFTVSRS